MLKKSMTVSLAAATETFASTVEHLRVDRILGKASYQALARMLPYAVERYLDDGTIIYRAGNPARELYLILEGKVELVGRSGHRLSPLEKWVGQEAATDVPHYFSDAVACGSVRILAINRTGLKALWAVNPELKGEFYISLMESLGGGSIHEDVKIDKPAKQPPENNRPTIIGWSLAMLLPAIMLFFGADFELPPNTIYFMAIFIATLVMWIFNLADEYVPGIFALLTTLAMGLVPIQVTLAGFASEGFILGLSVLGLGALMVTSGLGYRLLLLLLLKFPDRPFWHNTGLLFTGFLLTPLIPSPNSRLALINPLTRDMMEIARCLPQGAMATALTISTFTGASLLSAVFLSGQSANFIVFGLLSNHIKNQFDWLQWAYAAAVGGVVMISSHLLLLAVMFRENEYSSLPKERIAAQLSLLGNLNRREWAALIGILWFTMAVLTTFLHKIPSAWLGLAVLYGLLVFGMLGKDEFRKEIDWSFLMYLGGIVSITSTIHYLKLDTMLVHALPWLGEYMRTNFNLFLLILSVIVFLMRLVVPITATIVILITVLMPIADNAGVNPWIIGFTSLILGEMWFFPKQCSYYLQLREMTRDAELYDEATFLRFNIFSNLIKLMALYASIPYWRLLGLL